MAIKETTKGSLIAAIVVGLICIFVVIAIIAESDRQASQPVINKVHVVDSTMIQYYDSVCAVVKKQITTEMKKFKVKYDDISKITWIYSKSKPYYANTMAFYTYIGLHDDGEYFKRLVIRYHGDDWLFVNSIIIKTAEQTHTINTYDIERDNNSDVWEWINLSVGNLEDVIIQQILIGKTAKIRFVGDKYYKDWTLTSKEIKGLQEIEDYYSLLNGYSLIQKRAQNYKK
jgi:hypothetical protein